MSRPKLSLDQVSCESLVRPRVSAGRASDIAATLAAIHAGFAAEQTGDPAAMVKHWRSWTTLHTGGDYVAQSVAVARQVRNQFDTYVHVGIGGSDLGPRVCHEVLDHTLHNQLPDEQRGALRMYFAGDTFDPRPMRELLDLLETRGDLPRTVFNIVSRSGKTPETLCAMLAIRSRLGEDWAKQMIATTLLPPSTSILHDLAVKEGFLGILPVPDGVGGRFCVASPAGLLPLAAATNEATQGSLQTRLESALAGYAEGHRRMLLAPDDEANIAFRLAKWLHFAEEWCGIGSLVLYDYSGCRMLGDWLVQLYTESIQERGGGLNVIAARGPTSNHSLLNGIVSGPRDKIVLFIKWEDLGEDLDVPLDESAEESLRVFTGKSMTTLQDASCRGTIQDFSANGIPCLVVTVPKRDPYHLFLVMRILMDTVAVKGRLQGLHIGADGEMDLAGDLTYQQDGVEGYKNAMRGLL